MAVLTEEAVRANIRAREGKRVFYLDDRDHLTPSARQWLQRERIEILPAAMAKPESYQGPDGAVWTVKPEHMTHLQGNVLVRKDHPRIRFRGQLDLLEAEILLCAGTAAGEKHIRLSVELEELLSFARHLMRCDVLEEPLGAFSLCGLTEAQLREQSQQPLRYYDIPHFMPAVSDGETMLQLNRLRTVVRQTELAAYEAFRDREGLVTRPDLLLALNRMSSLVWILMIRLKKEETAHGS